MALHNVHDAIVSSDKNFVITAWNKAAEEMFGYDSHEVLEKKIDDIFNKIQIKPTHDELIHQLRSTGQFQGDIVYRNKNGQKRYGYLHIVSTVSEDGKLLGNVAVCSDLTELRKTEENVSCREKELEAILFNCPVGVAVTDSNYCIVTANEAFSKITGYSDSELKELTFKDFTHPDIWGVSSSHIAGTVIWS